MVPDWPVPSAVRSVCTTRTGGVSTGRYASLNLGDHVGDAPTAVSTNRQRLQAVIGARPVFLQQVHGFRVEPLTHSSVDGAQADACVTAASGLACTVMVADCLPVLFAATDGSCVGAAHAGWRGLAAGVLERTADLFLPATAAAVPAAASAGVCVWLGPCIGPRAFEVGDDVRAAMLATLPASVQCFHAGQRPGRWLADLPALARLRLAARGIMQVYGNDGTDDWCTVRNPSRFFSHRRDGVSGRLAACIWRA